MAKINFEVSAERLYVDDFRVPVSTPSNLRLLEATLLKDFSKAGTDLSYRDGARWGEIFLYTNPPTAELAKTHSKRWKTMTYLTDNLKFPPEYHQLMDLFKATISQPIAKITEPLTARSEPKTFILKVAHNPTCTRSWRYEGDVSEYLGNVVEVSPQVYGQPYSPQSKITVILEEMLDPKSWAPITTYFTRIDEDEMGKPFGRNLGRMHNIQQVEDENGVKVEGRFEYNDSAIHVFWNPFTKRCKRTDLGETHLLTRSDLRIVPNRERLWDEVRYHMADIVLISRPKILAMTPWHKSTDQVKEFIGKIVDGYNETSRLGLNIGFGDVLDSIQERSGVPRKRYVRPRREVDKFLIA